MRPFPLTNRGLTLPAIVTLVLLAALAALLAGVSAASAQGSAPDTPDQPIGTAVFIGGVDLEWNDVPGADSYDVQLFRNGQWIDLPGDGVEIAFYGAGAIISELNHGGSSYWFQVRAKNAHGSSDWSAFFNMNTTSEYRLGRQARPDNVPASGAPVIDGTAQVGETLTADTTGIEDGNGLDRVQFRFQWISDDGNTDTDIAGATDSTYALVAEDEGKTIKVRVAFTDRGGYAESLTSAATEEVSFAIQEQIANNPATGTPTITGTAQVGETLTASTSGIADADGLANVSYSYQWISNDGTSDTDITSATGTTYALVAADEGKAIKVRVSFSDDAANEETLTSDATAAVAARANSPATGVPTIGGTVQVGETLTADTTGIADSDGLSGATFSYQWISNDGTTDTDITGATDSTYTLVSGDEGDTIKVKVSFTDDRGNSETLTSAATIAVETPNSTSTIEISVTFTVEWEEIEEILAFEHTRVVIAVKGLPAVTAEYHFSSDFLDDQGANAYYCIQGPLGERVGTTPDTDPQETHVLYKETSRSPYSTYIPKGCTPGSYKLVTTWRNLDGSDTGSTEYAIDVAENPAVEQVAYVEPTYPDPPISTGYLFPSALFDWFARHDSTGYWRKISIGTGGLQPDDISTTTDYIFSIRAIDENGNFLPECEERAGLGFSYRVKLEPVPDDDSDGFASWGVTTIAGGPSCQGVDYVRFEILNGEGEFIKRWDASLLPIVNSQNSVATGAPAISGTARVGETLTADTTGIFDVDGLSGTTFSYQWISNDGNSDTDIVGATSSTYTLVSGDEGKTIKVTVSFTDEEGFEESLTSAATATVAGPNSPATGAPTIVGTAQVGETLTVDTSSIADADGLVNATFGYQWISNDGTTDTDIAGATDSTYTLVAADQGNTIKVQVTFTDDAANEETLTSPATAVVAARANSAATGAPAIIGTAQVGETLTADVSGIADADGLTNASYSYQWISNDGNSDTDITDATDSTYTLAAADEGKTIKVKVTFTDDAGFDETLTSTATETVSFAVQQQIANSPATGTPTITGTVQVGETLTADTTSIADTDGLSGATFSYQWVVNDGTADTDIVGATGSTYSLAASDEGKAIKVRVAFTDDSDNDETLTSGATAAVASQNSPVIEGVVRVGETLTVDTSGIANLDGLSGVTFSYQWISNDGTTDMDITGATGSTYTLTASDEGKIIKVRVTFTLTSAPTEAVSFAVQQQIANSPATGVPSITGTAQVGETLTADVSGIADADGLSGVTFSYQWVANDGTSDTDITGATHSTYTLVATDEGKSIQMKVSFTDGGGNQEELISAATAAVTAAEPDEPPAQPQGLAGTVAHDAVSLTWDDPGDATITSYQILRRDRALHDIGDFQVHVSDTGSAAAAYIDRDVSPEGSYVYRIKARNAAGLSVRSDYFRADTPSAPVQNSPATGVPTIGGTARVGETLTADLSGIADADGLSGTTFSYHWVANDRTSDTDITGATDSTYTLVSADEGTTIKVRVTFTDDAGFDETLTSTATEESVSAQADTTAPTVSSVAITSDPDENDADLGAYSTGRYSQSTNWASGVYRIGDDVKVTVTFNEDVAVTGSPQLELAIGSRNRTAAYEGTEGSAVVFSYTVAEGDTDSDGIAIGADMLTLNSGSIKDVALNNANLSHNALAAQDGHKVDGIRPRISRLFIAASTGGSDGAYSEGEELIIVAEFNEDNPRSSVTGPPRVKLDFNGEEKMAPWDISLLFNSPRDYGIFGYVVQEGDLDSDGVAISANSIDLNGGFIRDPAGNDAVLTHSAVAASSSFIVDAVAPTVSSIAITSDPGSDDTYGIGEKIEVTVTFSENMSLPFSITCGADVVHCEAELDLDIGGTARTADYQSHAGADVVYVYTVQAGDADDNGIAIGANKLTGQRIMDAAGKFEYGINEADLSHSAVADDAGHKVSGS